ncbi:11188_t:CDS:2 [Acaulospora colombiana]|uniref:11188_t:CDS:1 n=1 Tax=Acaulospora colombiana TaxID=27376 RepID=A0ACA9JWH5_9GLOM|nr:11188_t:CDS:2 [Acaulospora colombiana]
MEYDNNLALAIISGIRPKIYKDMPLEYVRIMQQCWDANPENRPNAITVFDMFCGMYKEELLQKHKHKSFRMKTTDFFMNKNNCNVFGDNFASSAVCLPKLYFPAHPISHSHFILTSNAMSSYTADSRPQTAVNLPQLVNDMSTANNVQLS